MIDLEAGTARIGEIPSAGRLAAVRDDKIYLITVDENDVEGIGIFTLNEVSP